VGEEIFLSEAKKNREGSAELMQVAAVPAEAQRTRHPFFAQHEK
jgi:hypothetical protein